MSIDPVSRTQQVTQNVETQAEPSLQPERNTVTEHSGAGETPADPGAGVAPTLLVGLIPIAGPLFLLAGLIGKIAELASKPGDPSGALPSGGKVAGSGAELARAGVKESVEAKVEESGSFGDERNGGSGKATAAVSAGARADAVVTAGPDGLRAAAAARAEIAARARLEGEVHGDAGRAAAAASAEATAYVEGRAEARATATGISSSAQASAGAEARADALVCAESAPIVKLGDAEWTAGAQATGYARSGAAAVADIEATASFNPPEVIGSVGAKAFAGARAGAGATLGFGPFKLEAAIDARAGAGVEYGLDFSFKDGKLDVKGFAGIAAAIGLGSNVKLSIDFNLVGETLAGLFGKVAAEAPPGSPGQAVAAGIADFVKVATPLAAQAAAPYSSFDLAGAEGGTRDDVSGDVKSFGTKDDARPQREKDAETEGRLAAHQQRVRRQLDSVGNGGRSKLDRSLV